MDARSRHNVPWSEADIVRLKSMLAEGLNTRTIASELGRTQAAIEQRRNILRGPGQQRRPSSQRRKNGASFFLS